MPGNAELERRSPPNESEDERLAGARYEDPRPTSSPVFIVCPTKHTRPERQILRYLRMIRPARRGEPEWETQPRVVYAPFDGVCDACGAKHEIEVGRHVSTFAAGDRHPQIHPIVSSAMARGAAIGIWCVNR